LAGALTSTLGMASLVYGFVHAATDGWAAPATVAAFLAGGTLLGAFVAVELRAGSPITPLRLFADRNRVGSYLGRLLLVAGMMGMFFFLTQFLRGVLGYSDLQTGFAFVPLTVTVFLTSQLSARVLVERFGDRRVMLTGLSLSMFGMLGLTQLGQDSGYLALLAPLVIFGAGNGLAFVPLTTAALNGVDPGDAGAASGLVNVMQQLGGSLGLAVLVTVFGSTSRGVQAHPGGNETPAALARHAFVAGADSAFWTATAMVLGAVVLVAALIRAVAPDRGAPSADPGGSADSDAVGELALAEA
jgi:hypothetical protein